MRDMHAPSSIRPRRSILYVPGGDTRMQRKSRTVPADGLVFDLEDSVAPEAKDAARALTISTIRAGGFAGRDVVVRTNGPGTPWFEDDLRAAAEAAPDAVLITKVESADEIGRAEAILSRGDSSAVRVWAMIETPRGVLACERIAAAAGAAGRLAGLVAGTNDLVKEIGARPRPDRLPALAALSQIVLVARAFGLFVLDGVFNDFSDAAGFAAECAQGRDLGFDGKTLIHPAQVETANRIFAPDAAELDEARRIVAAFALPENRGRGAIRLDGRMVELLHAASARRTLQLAEAIAALRPDRR